MTWVGAYLLIMALLIFLPGIVVIVKEFVVVREYEDIEEN